MADRTQFKKASLEGGTLTFSDMQAWKPGEISKINMVQMWNETKSIMLSEGEADLTVAEDSDGDTIGVNIANLDLVKNEVGDTYTAIFATGNKDEDLIMRFRSNMATVSAQEGNANALGRGGAKFINQGDSLVAGPFFNVVCVSNNVQFSQETTMQAGDPPPSNIAFISGFSFMLPFSQIKLLRGTVMAYNG